MEVFSAERVTMEDKQAHPGRISDDTMRIFETLFTKVLLRGVAGDDTTKKPGDNSSAGDSETLTSSVRALIEAVTKLCTTRKTEITSWERLIDSWICTTGRLLGESNSKRKMELFVMQLLHGYMMISRFAASHGNWSSIDSTILSQFDLLLEEVSGK